MDFPASSATPPIINTYSRYGALGNGYLVSGAWPGVGTITWPSANRAIYMPIRIPWPYRVARVFWANGGTITGNVDLGIYTSGGAKIYSTGSTAQSGTSTLQFVTVTTPFVLAPGSYYIAMAVSAVTANLVQGGTTFALGAIRAMGCLQQDTALPVPTSATFAEVASSLYALAGITRTASGF